MRITTSTLFSFRQNFRVKYVLISSSKLTCGKLSQINPSTLSNTVNEKIFSWAPSERQCRHVSWVFNHVLTQALHPSTCLQQMFRITGAVDSCWHIIQRNEFYISSRIAPKTLAVLFHSMDWLLVKDSTLRLISFMSSAINAMRWTID